MEWTEKKERMMFMNNVAIGNNSEDNKHEITNTNISFHFFVCSFFFCVPIFSYRENTYILYSIIKSFCSHIFSPFDFILVQFNSFFFCCCLCHSTDTAIGCRQATAASVTIFSMKIGNIW